MYYIMPSQMRLIYPTSPQILSGVGTAPSIYTYIYIYMYLTVACCFALLAACSLPTDSSHKSICHSPLRVSARDPRFARATSFFLLGSKRLRRGAPAARRASAPAALRVCSIICSSCLWRWALCDEIRKETRKIKMVCKTKNGF